MEPNKGKTTTIMSNGVSYVERISVQRCRMKGQLGRPPEWCYMSLKPYITSLTFYKIPDMIP